MTEVLLNDGIAELLWSVLLTSSYVAQDPETLSNASEFILERIAAQTDTDYSVDDTYSVEFVSGLLIATGRSDAEVERTAETLTEGDAFYTYRGVHIDPIGRVPAVNQNQAAVPSMQLYGVINQWALAAFPRFRG